MMHKVISVAVCLLLGACAAPGVLTLGGFSQWRTGHDEQTQQLVPEGNNAIRRLGDSLFIQVKFQVRQYGEVSFPINKETPEGAEALRTDLSESKFIRLTYRANEEVIVQLRQTGVHGGIQNHVVMPAAKKDTTAVLYFRDFTGGKTPLDLSDVSKFNFAFLANNPSDGFAELIILNLEIDHYTP